jgi:carboxyl-terminal processing protease
VNRGGVAFLVALALWPAVVRSQDEGWRDRQIQSFDLVWQTVADTFPDPAFGGVDWEQARRDFRPRVVAAASPDDARRVMREMLARLGQSHFVILSDAEAVEGAAAPEPVGGTVVQFGNLPALTVRTDVRELATPEGRRAGFIGFNVWMAAIDDPVARAVDRFRALDGIVLDLRGNPGGLAVMMSGIAGHFFPEPVLLGRMRTRQGDLEFRANPRIATPEGRRVVPFGGRLAILVDARTGSTSECFAGALQDLGRARLFGQRTMGQALPAVTKQLPTGDVFLHAIGTFTTSTGRVLEGQGLRPEVEVTPRGAAPDDAALAEALRWIDER